MLVHVEGEDRRAARKRVAVIRRPLVDELALAWRPRQKRPSRASAQRLSDRGELCSPPLVRPEVTRQGLPERRSRLAPFSQAFEVYLVEDHRIGGDELLALESVDDEHGRASEIELRKLRADDIEPLDGPAVVALV